MAKHCEYVQQIKHLKVQLNEIEDIIEKHKTIKEWAYIIHDKDVDKSGNPKEPHIHLYLNFGKSGASFETVAKWFKDEPQYVTHGTVLCVKTKTVSNHRLFLCLHLMR